MPIDDSKSYIFDSCNNKNNVVNDNFGFFGLHPCLATKDTCPFGKNCWYAKFPRNSCMSFLRFGTCKFGKSCRFLHPAPRKANRYFTSNTDNGDDCEGRASDSHLFPALIGSHGDEGIVVTSTFSSSAPVPVVAASTSCAPSKNNTKVDEKIVDEFPSIETLPDFNIFVNANSELPPGFAYRMHTISARAEAFAVRLAEARRQIDRLTNANNDLSQENFDLKKRCAMKEEDLRRVLRAEYATQMSAEIQKNRVLEQKVHVVERLTEVEVRHAREFASIVKNLALETGSSILDDARTRIASMSVSNNNDKSENDSASAAGNNNNTSDNSFDNATNQNVDEVSCLGTFTRGIAAKLERLKLAIADHDERLQRTTCYTKVVEIARAEIARQDPTNAMQLLPLRPNECIMLTDECPVVRKFFNAVPRSEKFLSAGGRSLSSNFRVVFHGTRGGPVAACKIECEGFDPQFRVSQACGVGEYFTPTLATAHGYGSSAVVASLVYTKAGVSPISYHRNDDYWVVDNPTDFSSTFVLPLGSCFGVDMVVAEKSCSCGRK